MLPNQVSLAFKQRLYCSEVDDTVTQAPFLKDPALTVPHRAVNDAAEVLLLTRVYEESVVYISNFACSISLRRPLECEHWVRRSARQKKPSVRTVGPDSSERAEGVLID